MQISENSVVSFHYTLTDKDGQVIDRSAGHAPRQMPPYET